LRMTDLQPLHVQLDPADPVLREQQAQFNALLHDVAAARAAVAQWKQRIEGYDQAVEPVRREVLAALREWVFALDTASLQPGLSRAEREQLAQLIRDTTTALLGEEVDDEEASARISDAWQEKADAAAAHREARAASRRSASARRRRERESVDASQSVRDVYRRLASALHPDREPDAQERERKTVLMQKANEAYAQGNLLVLLELQLAAEQIDRPHVSAVEPRRETRSRGGAAIEESGQARVRRGEAAARGAAARAAGDEVVNGCRDHPKLAEATAEDLGAGS
jgi:hypothetical protein